MPDCPICKQTKPETEFYRDPKFSSGHYPHCKSCKLAKARQNYQKNSPQIKAKARAYKQANPVKVRWGSLKSKGCPISLEEFQLRWDAWDGRCENTGCREKFSKKPKGPQPRLHCDHNHQTGTFRGFLCQDCNHAEGQLKTVSRAQGLVNYMREKAKEHLPDCKPELPKASNQGVP